MAVFVITAKINLEFFVLAKQDTFIPFRLFLKMYIFLLSAWIIVYSIFYFVWTIIFQYNHPMPFLGLFCFYPTTFLSLVALLTLFPRGVLSVLELAGNLKKFIFYQFGWIIAPLLNEFLNLIFRMLATTDVQFIMALLIPITKVCTNAAMSKVVQRMVGTKNESANVLLGSGINFCYGVFVATRLAGARDVTVCSLVAVDFLLQLRMSYSIVRLYKKVSNHEHEKLKKEKRKAILKLVLAELCEGLVHMAYSICFAMSYYGPNAKLANNVGIGLWGSTAVCEVNRTFLLMLCLFTLDLICVCVNAVVIWTFCNVNLFRECCFVLEKYWYIMTTTLMLTTYLYFFSNDINLAIDRSLRFFWLKNEEMFNITCNY